MNSRGVKKVDISSEVSTEKKKKKNWGKNNEKYSNKSPSHYTQFPGNLPGRKFSDLFKLEMLTLENSREKAISREIVHPSLGAGFGQITQG